MTTEKEKSFQGLIRDLETFSKCDIEAQECSDLFERILDLVFFVGEKQIVFTKEEKEKIGSYLVQNIDKILSVLLHFGHYFEPSEGPRALQYRSAIQFVLDDFKDFQIPGSLDSSKDKLGVKIEESDALKTLDNAIDFWKEDITVGLDIEGYSIESLYRPDNIPKNHIWWIDENIDEELVTEIIDSSRTNIIETREESKNCSLNEKLSSLDNVCASIKF
ncbi:hypothetical protein Bpfe_024328 [Biomphalaria pfeifferi]|uniref:Uncharacterized protein n=1 Tax=Biomphalaria pfeifferi TaxID=112525 RepID=A0AAD8B1C4_BIOPF|nr:hypothetical protein Bpfe_024328 [Biomphalaria pfeifferi]